MTDKKETPQSKTLDDLSRQIAAAAAAMEQQIQEVIDKKSDPAKEENKTAAAAGRLQIRRKKGTFIIESSHELIQKTPDGAETVLSDHDTKRQALTAGARHWLEYGGGAEPQIKDAAEILRRAQQKMRVENPDNPPAKLIARCDQKIAQWEEWEKEQESLAAADAIKRRRAAEEQARQEAQAAQEKARAENTEHARRAREPHRVLIGFRTPILNTVPEHDEAKAVYLLMEWKPDDDPAGLPSKIDRLSSREAQEWAKHLTIEGIDVSAYSPVMRLAENKANW